MAAQRDRSLLSWADGLKELLQEVGFKKPWQIQYQGTIVSTKLNLKR